MNPAHVLLALSLACGTSHATTPDARPAPPQAAETFARSLQSALQQQDVPRVMNMVAFPLRVHTEGGQRRRMGRAELLQSFDQVFTPAVVKAVLAQDPTALFQNQQGVMFGDGVVWAAETCPARPQPPSECPLRVITVNRPAR